MDTPVDLVEQLERSVGCFRRAAAVTAETHFGRLSVVALSGLCGLRTLF